MVKSLFAHYLFIAFGMRQRIDLCDLQVKLPSVNHIWCWFHALLIQFLYPFTTHRSMLYILKLKLTTNNGKCFKNLVTNQGDHYMLFVIYRTFVIRYDISLFIFVIRYSYAVFCCSHCLFICGIRSFFSNNTFLCCNESNAVCYMLSS